MSIHQKNVNTNITMKEENKCKDQSIHYTKWNIKGINTNIRTKINKNTKHTFEQISGIKVSAVQSGTTMQKYLFMQSSILFFLTPLNTQHPLTQCTQLYFLFPNLALSICTILLGPPIILFWISVTRPVVTSWWQYFK